jgi:molybdate transport system substrate-binding protein
LSSCLGLFLALSLPGVSVAQTTLTVAAAADLTNLEPDLGSSFRKIAPSISIRWVTSASAVLAQQIENGAPYDAFLSANAQFADRLASSRKLLPESVSAYAVGRVGILWRDNKHHPLKDLSATSVRFLALPNPKLAPYGVAAQQALERSGLWQAVQPKVVYGENVRQTLQLFESGNADAVLTSAALVLGKNPDVLPTDLHAPIIQKAGIVAASSHQAEGRQFLDFLLSPAGQAVFARFGFGSPH